MQLLFGLSDGLFQILRDIKHGLLQLGKEGIRGPLSGGMHSVILQIDDHLQIFLQMIHICMMTMQEC